MKNKAFRILLLVVLAVFAAASLTACSAAKDLVNEMTGKNDIVSVSYIKSVNGIEAQYKAGAVIDYDNTSVTVVYTNGEEKTVKLSQTSFDKIDTSTLGDKELKVVYKGAIFRMTVKIYVDVTVTKLSTPVGLKVDGNKLTWNAVKNASSYKVYINDREYESNTNSFVFTSQGSGTITFAVMAVSNSPEFENSDVSSELKVENMVQLAAPTEVKIDKTVLSWNYEGQTSDIYFVVRQDGGVAVEKTTETKIDLLSLNLGASDKPYVFSVYACSTDSKKMQSETAGNAGFKVTRLSGPKGVALSGKILTWERDAKAVKYRITVGENESDAANNVEVGAASTSFNITNYFGEAWFSGPARDRVGSYSFKVKALGYTAENAASLEKVSGEGYEYEWLLDSVASESVNYKVVQLATPYGLYVEDGVLRWSGDVNAASYKVFITPEGGRTSSPSTTETFLDLSEYAKTSNRYEIHVVATGAKEGLNVSEVIDSDQSESIEYVYRTPLASPTLTLSGNTLTWNTVENAGSYLLCTQFGATGKALNTTRKTLNADFLASLGYGSFDFYVIALPKSGSLYTYSQKSNEVNYVNSKTLDVPVVTASGTVISWPKVTDAEFYTLTVNGQKVDGGALVEIKNHTIVVRGESYDTSVLGAGSFTVTVKAENNDRVVYKPSANSAEVTVKSVSKLKTPASVNVNSDGNIEYSLVTSAEKYKIEIYDPDSIKLFECFNLNVSGANGLYDFADFLAENEMSAGIYRIDISAYASDEVAEFIVSSDVRNFNLRVTALSSATVTVGTRIGAYGDTDFGREVKWSSVRNALGYNVYVDGQKVNTDVVTGTSFTLSESANLAAGSTHEISVVALGNGKNLVDGEASSVSITLPSVLPIDENGNVSVAPSNVRIEGGMLRWDCVDENGVAFADSYTLDIEYLVEGSGMQKETVEVFTDSYTEFVTGRTYTVKVAANVKFSDGEKTVYTSDYSEARHFKLKSAINAAFADDVISWLGSAGTEYKIYFGDVVFSYVAAANGTQTFDVKKAVQTLDAGVYELRIAEVSTSTGLIEDNVYNRFSVITVLETPVVRSSGNRISWDAVLSAEKYLVTVDGQTFETGNTYIDAVILPEGASVVRVQAVSTQNRVYDSKVFEKVFEKLVAPEISNDESTISWVMEDGITYRVYDVEKNSAILVDKNSASSGNFRNDNGVAYISGIADLSSIEISATKQGVLNANTWSYPKADEKAASFGIEYGAGTIGVPYIIGTKDALAALANFENTYFKVTADLDLGEITPYELGRGNVVDFRNHTVKYKIYARAERSRKVGLFASNLGTIKNLKVEADIELVNVSVATYGSIVSGGVAAVNDGVIENVYVSGLVEGTSYVGGVAGRNNGTVRNAIVEASVSAKAVGLSAQSLVGGVVGYNVNGTVEGCSSNEKDILKYLTQNYKNTTFNLELVQVKAQNSDAGVIIGGIIGMSEGAGSVISDSYSYSNVCGVSVKGHVYAAGLVGWIKDGAKVSDCLAMGDAVARSDSGNVYAAGFVAASKADYRFCYSMGMPIAETTSGTTVNVGGFIARRIGGSDPEYCYYNVDTSGVEPTSVYDRMLATTTIEFKYMTSFGVENDKWLFFYNYENRPIFFPHLVSERWLVSYDETTGESTYTADVNTGLGTIQNPIPLSQDNALKYLMFEQNSDLVFLMKSDLDFSGTEYVQIPTFTANVWGEGHKIKGITLSGGTELGFIKRNYGNFYGVTVSDFDLSSSTRDGIVKAGAFAAYNAGILVDCKVENGRISVIALTDSAYVGAYAGVNSGIIWSNEENASLVKSDHTTFTATVGADVELIGQSKFGKNTVIGAVIGLNDGGYVKWVDAKASVRPVGTNFFKGGICGQNVQPTDEVGTNIDNIIDCFYSEQETMCDETNNLWGTAY